MLKSMRSDPKPQPPAAASAWMMPSEVALFGRPETSVFHGFAASKSWPPSVVVVVELAGGPEVDVAVLEVAVEEVDVELEVERDVEVVDLSVDVDELDDVVEVEARVVEVDELVVDVELLELELEAVVVGGLVDVVVLD